VQKTLRPVHANAGVEVAYRKKLKGLIDTLSNSVEYWLKAAYRKNPPKLATDASPVETIQLELKDLGDRWVKRFEDMAPDIAEAFVRSQFDASDNSFKQALKDGGWIVPFKMTERVRTAFQASLAENVGLIKSIPVQYLQQVEGIVMRSYSNGRDLQTMVAEIKELYPAAANRAVLIARDQSNKANAVVNRARQLDSGITRAKWMHSHGGKEPRKDHLAADGKEYDIAKGCLISGEYIQPGQLINCRCTSRPILPYTRES